MERFIYLNQQCRIFFTALYFRIIIDTLQRFHIYTVYHFFKSIVNDYDMLLKLRCEIYREFLKVLLVDSKYCYLNSINYYTNKNFENVSMYNRYDFYTSQMTDSFDFPFWRDSNYNYIESEIRNESINGEYDLCLLYRDKYTYSFDDRDKLLYDMLFHEINPTAFEPFEPNDVYYINNKKYNDNYKVFAQAILDILLPYQLPHENYTSEILMIDCVKDNNDHQHDLFIAYHDSIFGDFHVVDDRIAFKELLRDTIFLPFSNCNDISINYNGNVDDLITELKYHSMNSQVSNYLLSYRINRINKAFSIYNNVNAMPIIYNDIGSII